MDVYIVLWSFWICFCHLRLIPKKFPLSGRLSWAPLPDDWTSLSRCSRLCLWAVIRHVYRAVIVRLNLNYHELRSRQAQLSISRPRKNLPRKLPAGRLRKHPDTLRCATGSCWCCWTLCSCKNEQTLSTDSWDLRVYPGWKLPMQEHVIGCREIDVPTANGHHLQGRSRRQVKHQVGDCLQELVEYLGKWIDGLASQVQVTQRMSTSWVGGVGGPVDRADFGG